MSREKRQRGGEGGKYESLAKFLEVRIVSYVRVQERKNDLNESVEDSLRTVVSKYL